MLPGRRGRRSDGGKARDRAAYVHPPRAGELHFGGHAHIQLLGAAPEATCLYYERGLLRPGLEDPLAAPYLNSLPDPLDGDGNVLISQQPGLGLDLNWDYIREHRLTGS